MGKKKSKGGKPVGTQLAASVSEESQADAASSVPTSIAARLGHVLGLLCLFILPLASGGYSGWGYQFGFVLLPLAALLCLPAIKVSRLGAGVIALVLITAAVVLWPTGNAVHAGVVLWFCILALLAAWIVTRSMLQSSPDLWRWLFPTISLSAALTALAGLFPWWGHYLNSGDFDYYVVSTYGLHNAYAGFLLLAWPAAALAALQSRGTGRYLLWGACGLLIVTLFLTLSKASIAVFFLQVSILLGAALLRSARGRLSPRLLWPALAGGAALLLALLALPTVRSALAQLTDLGGYSMQGRLRFWDAALRMFADNPGGVGLGNFRYAFPQYQLDWKFYSVDPHSWALQLLAELGVVGALIALGIVVGFVVWAVGATRASPVLDEPEQASGDARAAPTSVVPLLTVVAVGGSLLHALFDFDYTFAATTALLGVLLAYGSSSRVEPIREPADRRFGILHDLARLTAPRPLKVAIALGVLSFALLGQSLTLERFVLDQLRDPALATARKVELLRQALGFVRFNESTHLQLAEALAWQGGKGSEEAYAAATRAWRLAPRNAAAHALLAALERDHEQTDQRFARALELDPYNHPEYYFAWAQAAQTPQQRYARLKLGVERIPAEHPITPDHIRAPDWIGFNALWAKWWTLLSELEEAPEARARYREIAGRFKAAVQPPAAAPPADAGDAPATED